MNISQSYQGLTETHFKKPLVNLKETLHETRNPDFKSTQRDDKLSSTAVPWRQAFPNYSDAMMTGISLRESRKLMELTQHQLSQRTGISQRQISALENGKQLMAEAMAKKFAEVLQVDYRVFL